MTHLKFLVSLICASLGNAIETGECVLGSEASCGDPDSSVLLQSPLVVQDSTVRSSRRRTMTWNDEAPVLVAGQKCTKKKEAGSTCDMCEGDCDEDNECGPYMRCFQRRLPGQWVPGCQDGEVPGGNEATDYCYQAYLEQVGPGTEGCEPGSTCGICQGDCDDDSGCHSGLKCFKRSKSTQLVPGCEAGGNGDVPTFDYCYEPQHCVRIMTGPWLRDDGDIEVDIKPGSTWVNSVATGNFGLTEAVFTECYFDQVSALRVHGPSGSTWVGSAMYSSNGGHKWESLICTDGCTSNNGFRTKELTVKRDSNDYDGTLCVDGNKCTLEPYTCALYKSKDGERDCEIVGWVKKESALGELYPDEGKCCEAGAKTAEECAREHVCFNDFVVAAYAPDEVPTSWVAECLLCNPNDNVDATCRKYRECVRAERAQLPDDSFRLLENFDIATGKASPSAPEEALLLQDTHGDAPGCARPDSDEWIEKAKNNCDCLKELHDLCDKDPDQLRCLLKSACDESDAKVCASWKRGQTKDGVDNCPGYAGLLQRSTDLNTSRRTAEVELDRSLTSKRAC